MKRRLLSLTPAAETAQRGSPEAPPGGGHRRTRPWTLWRLLPLLLLVCAALVISAGADYDGKPEKPDQDTDDVYQISSAAELYWFAGLVNGDTNIIGNDITQNTAACAVLTQDITVNTNVLNEDGTLNTNDGDDNTFAEWTPIGNSTQYTGTFDGQGHTISGLYCNISGIGNTYAGLFGVVGNDGKVQKVTVTDSYLSASTTGSDGVDSYAYAGGVCGWNGGGSITDCTNSGGVNASASGSGDVYAYAGGVCGYNAGGSIEGCTNSGAVSVSGSGSGSVYSGAYAGGVCGYNADGTITNCTNSSTVSAKNDDAEASAGGVCGYNYADIGSSATIQNCGNSGDVNASSSWADANAGGVCGGNRNVGVSATIQNCWNRGDVNASGYSANAGGVCGGNGGGSITDCRNCGTVSAESDVAEAFAGGVCGGNYVDTGSAVIQNCKNSGTVSAKSDANKAYAGGVCGRNKGDGYGSSSASVIIQNCTNSGAVNASGYTAYAGGVCGYNYANSGGGATIENCWNSGDVSGISSNNSASAGGVCGYNYAEDGSATITNCTNSGTVSAKNDANKAYAGGVCGRNEGDEGSATIENCWNSGTVSASGGNTVYAGGVCGYNYADDGSATIENCWNSGDVSGISSNNSASAGGVCGYNYANSGGGATIQNCWSSGTVSASGSDDDGASAGGVCGWNGVSSSGGSATIETCYWLDTAYIENGVGTTVGSATSEKVEAKSADAFASGEVAWLLNSEQQNGPWRQTLETDDYPVLDSIHDVVYRITLQVVSTTYTYCNGTFTLPDKPGYTLLWSDSADKTHQPGETVNITADTTFTARWTANTYTVTFNANGGAGTMADMAFTYDAAQALTANAFTRSGYTFAGWNTTADGSGTAYSDGQEVSNLTAVNGGTVTLYAQWTANPYTVTVETDGNGTASADPVSATAGTKVTLTATPSSGYHFDRWEVVDGDVTIEDNTFTMPAGEVTVTAHFARNSSGGGSRPTPTISQQIIAKLKAAKDGDVVTIDLPDGKTKLDKEVFEELAGRDVTLVLNLEDEVSWSIYGLDVPETGSFADTDMGVSMNAGSVPVDIINAITGEIGTMQMTLAHDGEFGFTLTLTAPLGAKNAGYWANLYYYDEAAETLTFQTSAKIGEDGTAALRFTHASQYVIIIDDRDHTPKDFPFVDVHTGDWFYEAVDYVFQRDLMNGTDETHFTPNGTSSRAMVATILWRMSGEPQVNYAMDFADVPSGTWYTEAVRWAASEGIVTGYSDTKFGPDDPVTREQFAVMLYRYAQTLGEGFTGSWSFPLNFPDAADVSDYAYEALCWMTMENVIQGMEDGNLHPQGTATRAQLATMLQRFCQAVDV